jgi:hypothetical protein
MSTPTLIYSDDDFEREFAGMVADYDRDVLPESDFDGHRRPKLRGRSTEKLAAIKRSLRGEA